MFSTRKTEIVPASEVTTFTMKFKWDDPCQTSIGHRAYGNMDVGGIWKIKQPAQHRHRAIRKESAGNLS